MAGKGRRTQVRVSAIIDARSRMADGTLIAGLRLGDEHLLDRLLRMLQAEVDECCVVGAEELTIATDVEAVRLLRVPAADGMQALAAALALTQGRTVLLFSAAQPFPDGDDCRRVLAALKKRGAAGVFHGGRMALARAQGESVLSSTPPDHYWITQLPQGFERGLLAEVLSAATRTAGADGMTVSELTLRLGHSIGLVEGRRAGFLIRDPLDWTLARALAAESRVA
jgi:2-C-methyl-D-erythritol 4-phosphate cytidylyltransferase